MFKKILPLLFLVSISPLMGMKLIPLPKFDIIPVNIPISQKTIELGKANWTPADMDNVACGFITMEYALGMYTFLHRAVLNKNIEDINLVINNAKLKKNRTVHLNEALDIAVHREDLPTINAIIALGADPEQWLLHNLCTVIRSENLHCLRSKCSEQSVQTENYKAPNNAPTQSTNPLDDELNSAIRNGDKDTVLLLVENGADLSKWMAKNGKTRVSPHIKELLLAYGRSLPKQEYNAIVDQIHRPKNTSDN